LDFVLQDCDLNLIQNFLHIEYIHDPTTNGLCLHRL